MFIFQVNTRLAELRVAHHPQIRSHRLLAVRAVLLGVEVRQIGRDLRQVVTTLVDSASHLRKSCTYHLLVGSDGSGAGDSRQAAEIEARACIARGRGDTVGGKNHLLVGCVLGLLVDLGESTTDGFDCVGIFDFSHSCSASRSTNGAHGCHPVA